MKKLAFVEPEITILCSEDVITASTGSEIDVSWKNIWDEIYD